MRQCGPGHLVVIGTSSGGLEALREIVSGLPADFTAAIAVVMHTAPQAPGILHEILQPFSRLPCIRPHDENPLRAGTIYFAPPNHHLLIERRCLRLTKEPKENRFRPAIDPLFRSAAQVFGPNAIGVVLTGNLGDGAAGLWTIKQLGGVAIVQDPQTALFPSMPRNAIAHADVDYILQLSDIPPLLARLTSVPERQFASEIPERVELLDHLQEQTVTSGAVPVSID